jgi:hypothetical protein
MLRFLIPAFAVTGALLVLFAGDIDHLGSIGAPDRPVPFANRTVGQPNQPQSGSQQPIPQVATQLALQDKTDPLQQKVDDLQQQASTLQRQLANSSQALQSRTDELKQRTRELQSAQAEAIRLRQETDSLRQQRQAADTKFQQLASHSSGLDRRSRELDARERELVRREALRRQRLEQAAVRLNAEQESRTEQRAREPQPNAATRSPSPAQLLVTARQWLAAGRPDEARRLLALAQTQMVLQPVTPDAPDAQGFNPAAADVGNAIHLLDMGATGQAMQLTNRAIEDSGGPPGRVRAWSGYPAREYSGYSQPYTPGDDER